MKPFAMTLASLLLFALPAFALEPDRCPAQFTIESYETDSIRISSQNAPQKTRIQTRLENPRTRKLFNFDVGLANIKAN